MRRVMHCCFRETHARLLWMWFVGTVINTVPSEAGRTIEVEAKLSRQSVPLNRTTWLTIVLRWDGAAHDVEVLSHPEPKLENATVVTSRTSNESAAGGRRTQQSVIRYQFQLKPKEMGMAYVQPTSVTCRWKGETIPQVLTAPRLSFEVLPAEHAGMRVGMKMTLLSIIALAIVALIFAGVRMRKASDVTSQGDDDTTENESPYERVKSEWEALEESAGTPATMRTLFPQAIQTLRSIAACVLDVPIRPSSAEGFAHALRTYEVPEEIVAPLSEVFALGERVKFANYEPSQDELAEAWRAMRRAAIHLLNRAVKEEDTEHECR